MASQPRRCLVLRVLAYSSGRVDYGEGPLALDRLGRWLVEAAGSPKVDASAGELCLEKTMQYGVFLRHLKVMLHAGLDVVWLRSRTHDVRRVGFWTYSSRLHGTPIVPPQ